MANTTFKNIQDRCLALGFAETDRDNMKLWLNEANQDILSRYPWMWNRTVESFSTVAGTATYTITTTLSGNLTTLDRIRPISTGLPTLEFIDYYSDQIHDFVRLSETDTIATQGTPTQWSRHGDEFYLYPTPDAVVTYQAEGQAKHVEMSGDSDAVVIPARFRHALIHYALSQAYLRNRNSEMYALHSGKYEEAIEEMKQDDKRKTAMASPKVAEMPSTYGNHYRHRH